MGKKDILLGGTSKQNPLFSGNLPEKVHTHAPSV